jgi:hypothetical protein
MKKIRKTSVQHELKNIYTDIHVGLAVNKSSLS